jgi:hypothetical protein
MSVRTIHTVRSFLSEHLEAFLPFRSVQPFLEQEVRQSLHHAARIRSLNFHRDPLEREVPPTLTEVRRCSLLY